MTVSVLLEKHRREAEENGFFLIEDLLSVEECASYVERLSEYARGARGAPDGVGLQQEARVVSGEVQAEAGSDVRKISGVHRDDLFAGLVHNSGVVSRMQTLLGNNIKLFRADVLMKPAGVGSAKGVHQDSPYWPIEPMELWSCWLPFDPATLENGCMTVIPGSHRWGALAHEDIENDYVIPEKHYDTNDLVPVEMAPGTGLFFHSLLVHGTAPNTSPKPRRAITMSYMAAEYRYTGTAPKPTYPRISGVEVADGV